MTNTPVPPVSPTGSTSIPLVGGILVINLDHRPERLERFREAAAAHPCLHHWERLPACNGQTLPGYGQPPWFRAGNRDKVWAGRAGCTLSHRQAILTARTRGWRSVLILEDDIEPCPAFGERLQEVITQADRALPGWAVCYLGVSRPVGPARPLAALADNRTVFKIFGGFGTFAYIVQASAYDGLLAQLPDETSIWPWIARHRAIDRWYAHHLYKTFQVAAISPCLVGHYASFSDIGQRAGATIAAEAEAEHDGEPIQASHPFVYGLRYHLLAIWLSLLSPLQAFRADQKARSGF